MTASHTTSGPSRVLLRLRPARRAIGAVLALLVAIGLTGCGLRLESPPLTEPIPDALEVSRRAVVADVTAIIDVATVTQKSLKKKKKAVRAELTRIITASEEQLAQLGGVYSSGLDAEAVGEPTPVTTEPAKPSIAGVVDRLAQGYSRTRGALESIPDPGLARLMSSIATFQISSASSLASIGKLELPDVALLGVAPVPVDPPSGISTSIQLPLISAEDSAGYAYEVLAARLFDAPRVAASARASVHRERGNAWSLAAQVSNTPQDPRRVAYDLPAGILAAPPSDAGIPALELNLAQSYATLVGLAVEVERAAYFDLLVDSYQSALTWGAEPVTFPGLPEQQ